MMVDLCRNLTRYGDRKDYPELTDEQWGKIGWDPLQDCFTCENDIDVDKLCIEIGIVNAGDFIICSHDFYMEHIWTKESRKREGQLPLLPEHSCVVFDEGHLLRICQSKSTYLSFQ